MPARRRPPARGIFINCPFDEAYKRLFEALLFAVYDCGFYVRCALETDAGELRFQTICQLIRECRYGIHDLSRTQLDPVNDLPRFNMPLELGLFLGAREFGPTRRPRKACLVLDAERYRYQQFCSDLAGVDVHAHDNRPLTLVREVRDWLQAQVNQEAQAQQVTPEILPEGTVIFRRLRGFLKDLPALCEDNRLNRRRLKFGDYVPLLGGWLRVNDWRPTGTQA